MNKIATFSLSCLLGLLLSMPAMAESELSEEDHEAIELSNAEILLWMTNHMDNIKEPISIRYDFSRTGTYGDGFTDRIEMDVVELHDDGSRSTRMEFFTGPRKQPVHDQQLRSVTGNPVLAIFMQGDVMEMNRITEGSWRYFQRQIKHALSDTSEIEQVTLSHDGQNISGQKVTIAPFVDDPRRPYFDRYADKTYEFIFSEDVPGMLYQIRTVIPDNINIGAEPLIVEELTYAKSDELDVDAEALSRAD